MEELKNLNLTEADFRLLVEGLDALPEKGLAGSMAGDLIGAMLFRDDEEGKAKFKKQREEEHAKRELEKEAKMEDVKILQGKLLLLKRHFQQNNLLREATSILDKD